MDFVTVNTVFFDVSLKPPALEGGFKYANNHSSLPILSSFGFGPSSLKSRTKDDDEHEDD